MRRMTSLFSRRPETVVRPAAPLPTRPGVPQDGITETICAPKLQPSRCLNEGGHKLNR